MSRDGKTFGLSKPREYLNKLEWEFERMMEQSGIHASSSLRDRDQ